MKWFDCNNYINYKHLELIRDIVIQEYNENKELLFFESTGMPVGELYDVSNSNNVNWFGYPIITADKTDDNFARYWPKLSKEIKNLPGVINCCVNFVGPNSLIPEHMDHAISKEVIGDREAIGIIIGVAMPSDNSEIVGFDVDGETKGWATGEIVAINGYLKHSGWNKSNQWRITLLIDLDKKYWNIK